MHESKATITSESVQHQLVWLEQHVLIQPLLDQAGDGVGVTDTQMDAGPLKPNLGLCFETLEKVMRVLWAKYENKLSLHMTVMKLLIMST